jgi:YrbI family 3-deoxy-D-manno-octulosonate 8-phosphate phosphatase
VFTDNRVLVSEDGVEHVFCTRADGIGLDALKKAGVPALVLSTETNPVVAARTKKLRLECIQGCDDKWAALSALLEQRAIEPRHVAFVGNDVNDLECLRNVGVPVCVADAYPQVKRVAKLITSKNGGRGAVREICDLIVQARTARVPR